MVTPIMAAMPHVQNPRPVVRDRGLIGCSKPMTREVLYVTSR
jgi:hypothetical protein